MKSSRLILTLTFGLLAAQATLAAMPGTDSARSRVVSLSGLDLSRPADAAHLYRNILKAATYVCEPLKGDDLARSMHFRKCVNDTVTRAVADVQAPLLARAGG